MPIYAYRCAACGHAKDLLMKVGASAPTTCPACGAEAFTKQVTAAGFQLKGSGWYVTDFRGGNKGAGADKGDSESKPAAEQKTDKADKSDKADKANKSDESDKAAPTERAAQAEAKPATESTAAPAATTSKPTSSADKA